MSNSNNNLEVRNPFRHNCELMVESLLKENEELKEDLSKSRNSNIVGTVQEITLKLFILILMASIAGMCIYGIHIGTIDNTSGQHQRNVARWTAQEYMRNHSAQNQNIQYNIYCRSYDSANNVRVTSCGNSFLICDVSHLNSQGNLIQDNTICCDSDERNSNDGCYSQ